VWGDLVAPLTARRSLLRGWRLLHGDWNLSDRVLRPVSFDPGHTALLVVDPVNDFIEVDDFLGAIAPATALHQVVKVGDTVYGSDRGKIGTVEEVVSANGGVPASMVVPRGRPTAEAVQAEYGPPAGHVDKLCRSHAPSAPTTERA
jgi:hypothetical protein